MREVLAIVVAASMAASVLNAQTKLQVTADKQNVVAGRIIGEWEVDVPLTTRLGGGAVRPAGGEGTPARVSFRSDSTVAGQVPAAFVSAVTTRVPYFPVFASGRMSFEGREVPFILTQLSGNPHILFWLERNGDRFGNAESFNVSIAAAKEPANDILFIGGDFNNQPFSAYKRVTPPGTGDVTPLLVPR